MFRTIPQYDDWLRINKITKARDLLYKLFCKMESYNTVIWGPTSKPEVSMECKDLDCRTQTYEEIRSHFLQGLEAYIIYGDKKFIVSLEATALTITLRFRNEPTSTRNIDTELHNISGKGVTQ